MTKKVLIMVSNPPFGTVFPAEAVRAAVAFAGMDLDTSIIFNGSGVFSLFKNQKPDIIEASSIKEGLSYAEEFGLKVYADKDSLKENNISNEEIEPVEIIGTSKIKDLVRSTDVIINF